MKWVGISGSRKTNKQVEDDVRREVNEVLKKGDGIVAGGAMGVDYFASDEVIRQGLAKDKLKICLPVTLDLYSKHYRKRAMEGAVTSEEAEALIKQLEDSKIVSPTGFIENLINTEVNAVTYFERNGKVVELSDELLAFQVNWSSGTQNTIDQAKAKGIPVKVFKYTI
jgi:predicted Rossmann fold nucleotide-binding protein DprA/Smf involved in DNA uptake